MSNLFVRKATGMVRSWSVFDAFIYAFFSINLVTLGFYSFSQMYYFGGGMIPALVVSAVFIIFEVIVYASLIAVMPRSGGDYVWQTRIFGGGDWLHPCHHWLVVHTLAVDTDLWRYAAPDRDHAFARRVWDCRRPRCGLQDRELPLFVCSLLTLVFVALVIFLGMKTYARIQKYSFYAGMLGLLIVIVLLFTGSPEAFKAGLDANAAAYFGTQGSLYDAYCPGRHSRHSHPHP